MKITVLAVGKVKESFYAAACAEYLKRLGRYCRPEIIEVADEKTPEGAGSALEAQIRAKEGERLARRIRTDAVLVALEIGGESLSSEEFADWIGKTEVRGESHIQFLIGGSLGLDPELSAKADLKLSFSRMTFPHQLARVILLEQIYRAFKILNHEPYHK